MLTALPEIAVYLEGQEVYDEDYYSSVYFDGTPVGTPVSKTFTITNPGTADLTLDAPSLSVPNGFSIVSCFADSVAPGQTTELVVQLDASMEGYYEGTLSFANNDADENPFNFSVIGEVLPANSPPVVDFPLSQVVVEQGTPSSQVPLDRVFTDPDIPFGDTLTYYVTGDNPALFSLSIDGAALTIHYQPDQLGSGTVTVQASDQHGAQAEHTFSVTVVERLQTPVATDDYYQVSHDQSLLVDTSAGVLASDFDPEGLPLQAELVDAPTHGLLLLQPDGGFTYTPHAGFTGRDSFRYRVNNGQHQSQPAIVTVEVTNRVPVAQGDHYLVPHDGSLTVPVAEGLLQNDADFDGDLLQAILHKAPASGVLQLRPDGSFTYTPDAGFVGVDTFSYCVSDGLAESDPVVVSIEVTNRPPSAPGDLYVVSHDKHLSAAAPGVLSNDKDPEDDALSATLVEPPVYGSVVLHEDGSFVYTPAVGFTGSDSFVYKTSDGYTESGPVVVVIDVVNHAPHAVADFYQVEDGDLLLVDATGGVLQNDTDADGDVLSAILVENVQHGVLQLGSDGSFQYTPTSGFAGQDSFTYIVNDGAADSEPATVSLQIRNNPPVALPKTIVFHASTANSGLYQLQLDSTAALDADGDPLHFSKVTDPSHGTLTLDADGHVTYQAADPAFVGRDSFTFTASDGFAQSNEATITLVFQNATPTARGLDFSIDHGQMLFISVGTLLAAAGDPDGDSLELVEVSAPSAGQLTFDEPNNRYVFHPGDFVGTATFTYTVSDGIDESQPGEVRIEVVNTPPWLVDESYQVLRGQEVHLPALAERGVVWDLEDSVTAVLDPSSQYMPADFMPDGSFSFSADSTGTYTITYYVTDGMSNSEPATVTFEVIDIQPVEVDLTVFDEPGENLAPIAFDDGVFTALHGETITGGVLFNDYDPDSSPLTVTLEQQPAFGTVTMNANGTFTLVPNGHYVGSDSFVYSVSDGTNPPSYATVRVEFTNQAPIALDDTFVFVRGSDDYVGCVNAWDPDGEPIFYTILDGGPGSLWIDATYGPVFTPPSPDWTGTAVFTYKVEDAAGASVTATSTIVLVEDPPPPDNSCHVFARDDTSIWIGFQVQGNVLGNDSSSDNCSLQVANPGTYSGNYGTLEIFADGSYTYQVNAGNEVDFILAGGEQFNINVTSYHGASDNSVLHIRPSIFTASPIPPAGYNYPFGKVGVWHEGSPSNITLTHYVPVSGTVFCLYAGYDGEDVDWTGPNASSATFLKIDMTGAGDLVSDISVAGRVVLNMGSTNPDGGDVRNVHGMIVEVHDAGNVGHISAFLIEAVEANNVASITATSPAEVGHARWIWANTVGDVYVQGHLGELTADQAGNIDVEGDAWRIAVNAGGYIHVGGHIGTGGLEHYYFDLLDSGLFVTDVGEIVAGGHITNVYNPTGSITERISAGGAIHLIDVGQSVTAAIEAGLFINEIHVGKDLSGAVNAKNGNIVTVRVDRTLNGPITASGSIGTISAGVQITESITAGGSINNIRAGTVLQSDGKYRGCINAPGKSITAGGHIGWIDVNASADCGGGIELGSISAGGAIVQVLADGDLNANVSAAMSIGEIRTGIVNQGTISGSITSAGSFIHEVRANNGTISSSITAQGNIGTIWSTESITGDITATDGSVRKVFAQKGSVGTVTAGKSIGNVSAGTDLAGNLLALGGGMGQLLAGLSAPGVITGTISAAASIAKVAAYGRVPGNALFTQQQVPDLDELIDQVVFQLDESPPRVSKPPRPPQPVQAIAGGHIQGQITAGHSIGSVTADGQIQQSIQAGKRLPSVTARGSILGNITSGIGSLAISTGDALTGMVQAAGSLVVSAYSQISGDISTSFGSATVSTWGGITGAISAAADVVATSYDPINGPTVLSQRGSVDVVALDDVNTIVQGAMPVAVRTLGNFSGLATSELDSVLVAAVGEVSAEVTARQNAVLSALGSFAGKLESELQSAKLLLGKDVGARSEITANETIIVAAQSLCQATLNSKTGDVFIVAGQVKSSSIHADQGGVVIDSTSSVEVESLKARQNVVVQAIGHVKGNIRSDEQSVFVAAHNSGNIDAELVTDGAAGQITAVAWGSINGPLRASQGSIWAFGFDGINKQVTAGGDVELATFGSLQGKVTAGGNAELFVRHDLHEPVAAGKSVSIDTGGSVLKPVAAGSGPADHLEIRAVGNVSESLFAGGNITVTNWGSVQSSSIISGGSIRINSFGSFNVATMKAAGDVTVNSAGSISAQQLSAGSDVRLGAYENLTNTNIEEARHAELVACGQASQLNAAAAGSVTLSEAGSALTTRLSASALEVRRFFYDPRSWSTISREYWKAHGGAQGRSLHHWLIPQRWKWVPQGIRNAGFNLLDLPDFKGAFYPNLSLNTFMGFAPRWGGRYAIEALILEKVIRAGIPALAAADCYFAFKAGSWLASGLWAED